ncbi:MAG: hypothetical protein Q8873_02875 [Bacillota bacterium]|nr:hypothetical protein [Bacillota bacterium]
MEYLEPYNIITLPSDCCKRYSGIAFDGCFFYVTLPQDCSIYKLDKDFKYIDCIKTGKPYSNICYDNTENCFWASSVNIRDRIYKLDCKLNEIDYLVICQIDSLCSAIKGLSYNCLSNTLFVAFDENILEISKDGCHVEVIKKSCVGAFTSVLSIPPYYVTVKQCGKTQEISLYSCDGCFIKSFCFPIAYIAEDILLYPCIDKDKSVIKLIILATKHFCYPKILLLTVNICDAELCCCNYDFCCQSCNEDTCKYINDLIESIALVETALSHILNAEGEKLQKAVEVSEDVCELMDINKVINKTITNITHLEQILYAKLDVVNEMHPSECGCEKKKNNKCKSPLS